MLIKRVIKAIRANILVGLFLTVPVVATILIFNFLFSLTTDWLINSGAFPLLAQFWAGYPLRVLTLCSLILGFYLVGLLTRNFLGRGLYRLGDKLLTQIPFFKGIYVSVRQISESLFTQRKTLFKDVVVVEYPRKGLFSLAFVTSAVPPSITSCMQGTEPGEDCVSLFIPTTPNPTSGILILVRKADVRLLNMPVADALTFVMSGGAVSPGDQGDTSPTLLDKLESWLKQGEESSSTER